MEAFYLLMPGKIFHSINTLLLLPLYPFWLILCQPFLYYTIASKHKYMLLLVYFLIENQLNFIPVNFINEVVDPNKIFTSTTEDWPWKHWRSLAIIAHKKIRFNLKQSSTREIYIIVSLPLVRGLASVLLKRV